jgi:D-glycero-D-manno-heptose 1,7-bisphosphate phosphatase
VDLKKAVFLDRDGTINEEKDYLFRPEEFAFIPGAPEAIARLKNAGFLVIVVTNQSGVARGYFGIDDVRRLHEHLQRQLAAIGTTIDGFYLCPHHPAHGVGEYRTECDCRKGRPGMLLQAAAEHGIDLRHSYMVGDKLADVEAGRAAGCRPLLVLTGYGQSEAGKLPAGEVPVVADLSAAADYILAARAGEP